MPFDFLSQRHYSINYLDLFDEINSKEILNDKSVQTKYLMEWIKVLKESDNFITKELETKESIIKMNLLLQSEPEIFQLPINFQRNKILMNFRVSIANKIIGMSNVKSEFIEVNEFIEKDSNIYWTPINEYEVLNINSKEPIVIVPFLNGKYSYLVIDGNHRLTYKTKRNINDIRAFIIAEQSVIEHSLFSSGFDKLYYIMHNELNHMAEETESKNTNAFQLIHKSYLTDGNFKFI